MNRSLRYLLPLREGFPCSGQAEARSRSFRLAARPNPITPCGPLACAGQSCLRGLLFVSWSVPPVMRITRLRAQVRSNSSNGRMSSTKRSACTGPEGLRARTGRPPDPALRTPWVVPVCLLMRSRFSGSRLTGGRKGPGFRVTAVVRPPAGANLPLRDLNSRAAGISSHAKGRSRGGGRGTRSPVLPYWISRLGVGAPTDSVGCLVVFRCADELRGRRSPWWT